MTLRSYNDHKNQINCLDFAENKRAFVSCSNETSWKYYDIQSSGGAVFTCQAAHSDHIKQVQFLPGSNDIVLSGASDKLLKCWRIENNEAVMVSQVALNEAIEKFVVVQHNYQTLVIAANGNLISILSLSQDNELKVIENIHVF